MEACIFHCQHCRVFCCCFCILTYSGKNTFSLKAFSQHLEAKCTNGEGHTLILMGTEKSSWAHGIFMCLGNSFSPFPSPVSWVTLGVSTLWRATVLTLFQVRIFPLYGSQYVCKRNFGKRFLDSNLTSIITYVVTFWNV